MRQATESWASSSHWLSMRGASCLQSSVPLLNSTSRLLRGKIANPLLSALTGASKSAV